MPIVTEYSLTFDDYQQGAAATRARLAELQRRASRRSPITFIIGIVGGLVVFIGASIFSAGSSFDVFMTAIIVPLTAATVLGVVAMLNARRPAPLSWRAVARLALAFTPILILPVLWFLLRLLLSLATRGTGSSLTAPPAEIGWAELLVPHGVWLLLVVVVGFSIVRSARDQTRLLWDGQTHLHRPQHAEFDDDVATFTDGLNRRQYAWLSFRRWEETPATFLLFISEYSFEIVPKRAFVDPAQLDQLRALLAERIRDAETAPKAFEIVRPVAKVE